MRRAKQIKPSLAAIPFYIIAAVIFYSCGTTRSTVQDSASNLYMKVEYKAKLEFKPFHISNDSTQIFIKLYTNNLLYIRNDEMYNGGVILDFVPRTSSGEKLPELKTKSVKIVDRGTDKSPKELLASTILPLPFGHDYTIEVTVKDINRDQTRQERFNVIKSDLNHRHNFLILEKDSEIPVLTDRVKPNKKYKLRVNRSGSETVYARYYDRSFPPPYPPFVYYEPPRFNYSADSTFKLDTGGNHTAQIKTGQSGFYHFLRDSTQKQGFTIFVSSDEFPEVTTVKNMVDPFRYLLGGKDYQDILESDDQKKEIESLWIEWIGNKERARKAIKKYYKRVETANIHFSSHLEGWQSDRGMIYIIYGEPNKIYRTDKAENWIYGEENNPLSLTFDFVKVINPFTENDYRLLRNDIYKSSYHRSVNAWRDGRIY